MSTQTAEPKTATKKANVTLVGKAEKLPLSKKEQERIDTLIDTEPTIHGYPWGQLREVANQCFSVVKEQLQAPKSENANFNAPNAYGIYKTTGGDCLGVVGNGYDVIEPLGFLKIIHIAFIKARKESMLKSIQFNEFFKGEVFGFKVPLKTFEIKTKLKTGDVTEMYLDFKTGLNGIVPSTLSISLLRCFCDNGCVSAEKGAKHSFKHLKNKNAEVLKYALALIESVDVADKQIEVMEAFAKKELKGKEIKELFEKITGYNVDTFTGPEKNEQHYKKVAAFDKMWGAMQKELKDTGKTAFGFFNGITQYTNHYAPLQDLPAPVDTVKASPDEIRTYNKRKAEVEAFNKLIQSRTTEGSKARAEVYEFNKQLKELTDTTFSTLKDYIGFKDEVEVEA